MFLLIKEKLASFSIRQWFYNCIICTLKIIVIPVVVMLSLSRIEFDNAYLELVVIGGISLALMLISIYIFGLKQDEREFVKQKILSRIGKES